MMRQQQSDIRKKPSKFCKFILLLVGFKICLLGVVLAEPFVSISTFLPSAQNFTALPDKTAQAKVQTGGEALSQTVEGASLAAVNTRQAANLATQAAQTTAAPVAANTNAAQTRHMPGAAFAATPGTPVAQAAATNSLTLEALNRKQEELARREQDLRALETELDTRLVQLQGLEIRLQTMLQDAEDTKGEKYKHLVDVLSNMKSRQAAGVLETLDEKIAVRVLSGMRGRQAGEILTYATPQKAARLTEALARMQMPLE